MRFRLVRRAARDFEALPPKIQQRALKQFDLLCQNLQHPSIRAKKYDQARDIWQGRISRDYRFWFRIVGDTYVILAITAHPK